MFIRAVGTISLVSLLIMVLYLPSVYSADQFMQQVRLEHEMNTRVIGADHALRILARMLDLQSQTKQVSAVPEALQAAAPVSDVNAVLVNKMSEVGGRLFNNSYFRSIDALLVLGAYRVAVGVEYLPLLSMFALLAVLDGLIIRVVRTHEFVMHNPEMFALHACLAIVLACAAVIACVLPMTVHPYVLIVLPLLISLGLSRAAANYHRRG